MTYEIDKFIGKPYFVLCWNDDDSLFNYFDFIYVRFSENIDEDNVGCEYVPAYFVEDYQYDPDDQYPSNYCNVGIYPKSVFEIADPLEILSIEELQELLEQADKEYEKKCMEDDE